KRSAEVHGLKRSICGNPKPSNIRSISSAIRRIMLNGLDIGHDSILEICPRRRGSIAWPSSRLFERSRAMDLNLLQKRLLQAMPSFTAAVPDRMDVSDADLV